MELPSTEHYEITVVEDPDHAGYDVYAVMNKDTKVFEYYDNLLPRAYQAMVQTETKYAEMEVAINGGKSLELVSVNSDKIEH